MCRFKDTELGTNKLDFEDVLNCNLALQKQ